MNELEHRLLHYVVSEIMLHSSDNRCLQIKYELYLTKLFDDVPADKRTTLITFFNIIKWRPWFDSKTILQEALNPDGLV